MVGDTVGYALIKKQTSAAVSTAPLSDFQGEICRVLEFGPFDDVMVVNSKGTALCMFEPNDISSSFKCSVQGEIITPPNLNFFEQMAYASKAFSRKGGYNYQVKALVIAASIHSNKFNDSLLWAKQ